MNYAIKTEQGYVSRLRGSPQSNRVLSYTSERASARWYQTHQAALNAARRLGVSEPYEIQHETA